MGVTGTNPLSEIAGASVGFVIVLVVVVMVGIDTWLLFALFTFGINKEGKKPPPLLLMLALTGFTTGDFCFDGKFKLLLSFGGKFEFVAFLYFDKMAGGGGRIETIPSISLLVNEFVVGAKIGSLYGASKSSRGGQELSKPSLLVKPPVNKILFIVL